MKLSPAKFYAIVLAFCCLPCFLYAQQNFTVNGIIYRKNTSERIAQATITDLKSDVIMMSDELGVFNIKAAKGDTLLVKCDGYAALKQVVYGPGDIIVYLAPVILLKEVIIKGETEKQQVNDVIADYRSQGIYFDGKPTFWEFLNSPLTGLYETFGKLPSEERRFEADSQDELQQAEVTKRYNAVVVKQVTKLTDDNEVKKFMDYYKPSYEDIKGWNDYELISHIKKAFEDFQKNKGALPPPPPKLY